MKKTSVYAIRIDTKYALLQYIGNAIEGYNPFESVLPTSNFYVFYKGKVDNLDPVDIDKALSGSYFYAKWLDCDEHAKISYTDIAKQNFGKEVELSAIKVDLKCWDAEKEYVKTYSPRLCEGCYLTYVGEYPLPENATPPLFTRGHTVIPEKEKCYWVLYDELYNGNDSGKHKFQICDKNGQVKLFESLTEEMLHYPLSAAYYSRELVKKLACNWSPEQCDDHWLQGQLEEYYQEYPYERPGAYNFDDVKYPLPTENWKAASNDWEEKEKVEYHKFCDSVEAHLKEFIETLESNRKATQKPLIKLIKALNKMEEDIDTMEAEELYEYIAKILSSLNKGKQVEILENMRDW